MDLIGTIVHDQQLQALTLIALVCALADTVVGILAAIRAGDFTLAKVADWLGTHVLMRVVPIVLLAFLSAALGAVNAQNGELQALVAAATLGAWGAALAYLGETLASLGVSVRAARA